MYTIQVNNFVLGSTNKITISRIDYDPSVPLNLNILEVGRRPGAKLVSSVYGTRDISVRGVVTGTSINNAQTNFDTMKKNVIGTNLNLDIHDGTVNRRFIVSCRGDIKVDRQSWETTIIHFTMVFVALDPPFGIDAMLGAASKTVTNALTASGVNSEQYSASVTFSGTAPPDVVTKFVISSSGSLSQIELVDFASGRTLQFSPTFRNNDVFEVNSTDFTVTQNLIPIPFSGQFPAFSPGANNVGFNFNTLAGNVLDQSQTATSSTYPLVLTASRYAQSFVVSQNSTVSRLALILGKVGNGADFNLSIQTDSGGAPSGTNVTNGSVTVTAAQVATNPGWIYINFSPAMTLSASTTYWMVITPSTNSLTNYNNIYTIYPSNYSSGIFRTSLDSGATYADVGAGNYDWAFKIYRRSVGETNILIEYNLNTETFATTTYKDAGATTANWDTTNLQLVLGS